VYNTAVSNRVIEANEDALTLLTAGSAMTMAWPSSASRPTVPPVHVIMNREDLAIHDDSITIARIHGVQNCTSAIQTSQKQDCNKFSMVQRLITMVTSIFTISHQ